MPARRLSDSEKKLRGTFKPSLARGEGVQAPGLLKTVPRFLNARQRQIWRHVIDTAPPDLLRRVDREIVAGFVIATDRMRQANLRLDTLRDPQERRRCQREITESTAQLATLSDRLAFNPATRQKLKAEPAQKDDSPKDNPWSILNLRQAS
jgi:P27 family predicted phage terminase small subunit